MKLKVLSAMGPLGVGQIVDCVHTQVTNNAYAYDAFGCGWVFYAGQYELIKEDEGQKVSTQQSIRDLIGQDLKQFTVEFK